MEVNKGPSRRCFDLVKDNVDPVPMKTSTEIVNLAILRKTTEEPTSRPVDHLVGADVPVTEEKYPELARRFGGPVPQSGEEFAVLVNELLKKEAESGNKAVVVKLVSKQGDSFPVGMAVAEMSQLVKDKMEQTRDVDGTKILLPEVTTRVLIQVLRFCEHHLREPLMDIEKPLKSKNMADLVQKWYVEFVDDLDLDEFVQVKRAAHYMDIEPLLNLTCAKAATLTPEEFRSVYKITVKFPDNEASSRVSVSEAEGGIKLADLKQN